MKKFVYPFQKLELESNKKTKAPIFHDGIMETIFHDDLKAENKE